MLLAAYLLARAENGQLRLNQRYLSSSDESAGNENLPKVSLRNQPRLLPVEVLRELKNELRRWGATDRLDVLPELLWKAEFLAVANRQIAKGSSKGKAAPLLRPTAAAYRWLQLPVSLTTQLLFDAAGLELSSNSVETLLTTGIRLTASTAYKINTLALFGLIERDYSFATTVVYRARPEAQKVLTLLSQVAPDAEADDVIRLELSAAWQELFPGSIPLAGWMSFTPANLTFTFKQPGDLGKPLSFDPWQLFRVFCVSELKTSESLAQESQLSLELSWKRVRENGVEIELLGSLLKSTTGQVINQELLKQLAGWLEPAKRVRIRRVILLEAPSREIFQEVITDRILRRFLPNLISNRYALVKEKDLSKIIRLLEQRNFTVYIEANPVEASRGEEKLDFSTTQLQLLSQALTLLRRDRIENGINITTLDELREKINAQLSATAQYEASLELKDDYKVSSSIVPVARTTTHEDNEFLAVLEQAINLEKRLELLYESAGGVVTNRQVEPIEIIAIDGQSYLLAYCYLRRDRRMFKVERVKNVVILED